MTVYLNNESMEVPDGTMLTDIIAIADDKQKLGNRGMCVLNGVLCAQNNIRLKENDKINYIPVLDGG